MNALATPPPPTRRSSYSHPGGGLPDPAPGPTDSHDSGLDLNPHHRGGTVLFEVPFTSAMSDADLAVLGHVLDLWTHMYPKMRPDPTSPGIARLDHVSGLFLDRGPGERQWVLQARTWGTPAPQTVHEWHLLAAQAARQLDQHVVLPERLPDRPSATQDRPLGPAAHTRLAQLRRRLVGLP